MKDSSFIYTYRPYYIDSVLLFDLYSTVMDGFSDAREIVEIVSNDGKTQRAVNGKISASPFLFFKASAIGKTSSTIQNTSEKQIREKQRLSPCVLLNWMLNEMENDRLFGKTKHQFWRFLGSSDNIGKPLVLSGRIIQNSIGAHKEHHLLPTGFRGLLADLCVFFSRYYRAKQNLKQKCLLITSINSKLDLLLRSIDLELDLLIDTITTLNSPYLINHANVVSELADKTKIALTHINYGSLQSEPVNILFKDVSNSLFNLAKLLDGLIDNLRNDREDYHKQCIHMLIPQKARLNGLLAELADINLSSHKSSHAQSPAYVFDLKKSMFYNSSIKDVMSLDNTYLLALVKRKGYKIYELEVVSIFQ